MSINHGGTITIKPIKEVAAYRKNLIPANIPETYALKPMFEDIASDENIRKGIVAFRDFLYLFCDCLATGGHEFAKPPKKPKSIDDYPFLHNITNLLVEIGFHGKLAGRIDSADFELACYSYDALIVTKIPSCTATIDENGKRKPPKISASSAMECLRFLTFCGFVFKDAHTDMSIDFEAKTLAISETQALKVLYPCNPILLTGLKAMAIADIELRATRRYWNDNNLLRCDYRALMAENPNMLDVLKDFLHPLPVKLQDFATKLHQRHIDMGLTCATSIRGDVNFAYSYVKNSRRVLSSQDIYAQRIWEFSYSIRDGYCIFVRAKKTDKYRDVIENFPSFLREKIARGYGCDRKLHNERCQGGCKGICIPLDDTMLSISKDIETWLDNEVKQFQ